MEKIEFIVDENERKKALKENTNNMHLDNLFSPENEYEEAIGVITRKQVILQPVSLSHAMVALNVLETIIEDFKFTRSPVTMHSDLMYAVENYMITLAYIQKEHIITIVLPPKINFALYTNIISFLSEIKKSPHIKNAVIYIGDLERVKIDDERIITELQNRLDNNLINHFAEINLLEDESKDNDVER